MLPSANQIMLAVGCTRALAEAWETPLRDSCRVWEIDTRLRLCAFLATIGHESTGLTRQTENMSYSTAARIVEVFRKFDTDKDRNISAQELAHAATFIRQPEKLANFVYSNRMGNGSPESGDGYRYRARGPIGTTGKTNYEAATEAVLARVKSCPDFVRHPELLESPQWGALAAGAFWDDNELNSLADTGDFLRLSVRVNGRNAKTGLPNGWPDRRSRYARALKAIPA